jgi:hypothetical protein
MIANQKAWTPGDEAVPTQESCRQEIKVLCTTAQYWQQRNAVRQDKNVQKIENIGEEGGLNLQNFDVKMMVKTNK